MRVLLIAACLSMAAPALAQTPATAPTPRETAAAVAEAVRSRYFDPAKGDEIADALEAEAARGAYDGLTTPQDLASALTQQLKPSDAHFVVVWDPQAPAAAPPRRPEGAPPPQPRARPVGAAPVANPAEARGNYGFREARILPGNVGYFEMASFANIRFDNPDDPARRRADAVLQFLSGTDAVIIDLRQNGGGAPSMVGYLVSAFVGPDADVYNVFHSRQGTTREAPAVFHPAPRTDVPVYILTSGRTGSAGEALPYTLQAARRATIVGEASGGAANPGGMVPVGGRFAVFVSGGSPRNPITGRNWEGTGVVPDVAVPWDQALDRAHALALEGIVSRDARRTDATWTLEAMRADTAPGDLSPFVGAYADWTVAADGPNLRATRGRRPPLVLQRLGGDLFTVVDDPMRRVTFVRGEGGEVSAFDLSGVGIPASRARRSD